MILRERSWTLRVMVREGAGAPGLGALHEDPGRVATGRENGAKGLRSWSVSGRVQYPGVVVAPAGITAAELITRAGGMGVCAGSRESGATVMVPAAVSTAVTVPRRLKGWTSLW